MLLTSIVYQLKVQMVPSDHHYRLISLRVIVADEARVYVGYLPRTADGLYRPMTSENNTASPNEISNYNDVQTGYATKVPAKSESDLELYSRFASG